MNERIFELAEQAENYATTRHSVSNISLSVNSEKFVKKFAELIVRECAGLCNEIGEYCEYPESEAEACAEYILKHFGVEE